MISISDFPQFQDAAALRRELQQPSDGALPRGARGVHLRDDAVRPRDRSREVRGGRGRVRRLLRVPLQ